MITIKIWQPDLGKDFILDKKNNNYTGVMIETFLKSANVGHASMVVEVLQTSALYEFIDAEFREAFPKLEYANDMVTYQSIPGPINPNESINKRQYKRGSIIKAYSVTLSLFPKEITSLRAVFNKGLEADFHNTEKDQICEADAYELPRIVHNVVNYPRFLIEKNNQPTSSILSTSFWKTKKEIELATLIENTMNVKFQLNELKQEKKRYQNDSECVGDVFIEERLAEIDNEIKQCTKILQQDLLKEENVRLEMQQHSFTIGINPTYSIQLPCQESGDYYCFDEKVVLKQMGECSNTKYKFIFGSQKENSDGLNCAQVLRKAIILSAPFKMRAAIMQLNKLTKEESGLDKPIPPDFFDFQRIDYPMKLAEWVKNLGFYIDKINGLHYVKMKNQNAEDINQIKYCEPFTESEELIFVKTQLIDLGKKAILISGNKRFKLEMEKLIKELEMIFSDNLYDLLDLVAKYGAIIGHHSVTLSTAIDKMITLLHAKLIDKDEYYKQYCENIVIYLEVKVPVEQISVFKGWSTQKGNREEYDAKFFLLKRLLELDEKRVLSFRKSNLV